MPRTSLSLTNLGLLTYYSNFYSAPTTNISAATILGTNTYPTLSPGYSMGNWKGSSGYLFYLRVNAVSNGNVSITYPWSQGPSTQVGTLRQAFTPVYSYISISATADAGYAFDGFYNAATGRAILLSATNPVNVSVNDIYYDQEWFARFVAITTTTTTTTTTTSGCVYTPLLGYDASDDLQACAYNIIVNRYSDTGDISSATMLYNNSGCSVTALAGWYSNGVIARYWNGSSFSGFAAFC